MLGLTIIKSTATLIFVIVIGITGGIGTGKSTVSDFLAELGAAVIDADKLGHELLQSHSDVREELVAAFGQGILSPDSQIDRAKLGQIVFGNPQALKLLNNIMHPRMYKLAAERIEGLRKQGVSLVVLEAALLIEANWISLVDQVWVTVASEETVVERLGKNKGIAPEDVRARIRSQLSATQRTKHARVVINTDCSLEELRSRVRLHWQHLMASQSKLPTASDLKQRIRQALMERVPKRLHNTTRKRAAVLMALFERGGEYHVLFTRRTDEVNYHKGQISFPGGGISSQDKTARDTALRESYEEIGLRPEDVEILGDLDDMYTVSSDFIVTPFVAIVPAEYNYVPNPAEVKEIISIPLNSFWTETRFWLEASSLRGHAMTAYYFEYKGEVVWGATARILKGFLDLLLPPPDFPA